MFCQDCQWGRTFWHYLGNAQCQWMFKIVQIVPKSPSPLPRPHWQSHKFSLQFMIRYSTIKIRKQKINGGGAT